MTTLDSDPTTEPAGNELVITRTFDAPRDLVFKAMTEAEHLSHWWGPKGLALGIRQLDVRPGGVFHYSMTTTSGNVMWGRFTYREIVAPERLVFTNSFADEEGNIVRAPFSGDWPLETLNTWTLTEEGGKTTLILRAIPHSPTEAERKTFESGFQSMRQGFGGTMNQLDAYLEKIQAEKAV